MLNKDELNEFLKRIGMELDTLEILQLVEYFDGEKKGVGTSEITRVVKEME